MKTFEETKSTINKAFGITDGLSKKGHEVEITIINDLNTETEAYIAERDENYVFNVDFVKSILLCIEKNYPCYVFGSFGSGKSTGIEQVCERVRRRVLRIQHSRDLELSQIEGVWTVSNGETKFQIGPLAYAMRHGLVYIADEYDAALPSVILAYQAVLEGKPLIIKGADEENRVIYPHPNFRFFATGNTNGLGDETGLYQGTSVQNAANLDRFGMVLHKEYMSVEQEAEIISRKTGADIEAATEFANFAKKTREMFEEGDITFPISTRSLVRAVEISFAFGNFEKGFNLAYMARLDEGSKAAVTEIFKRTFAE